LLFFDLVLKFHQLMGRFSQALGHGFQDHLEITGDSIELSVKKFPVDHSDRCFAHCGCRRGTPLFGNIGHLPDDFSRFQDGDNDLFSINDPGDFHGPLFNDIHPVAKCSLFKDNLLILVCFIFYNLEHQAPPFAFLIPDSLTGFFLT